MPGSPLHQRKRTEEFEEFETISPEEGLITADFSIPATSKDSDSNSTTSLDMKISAQRRSKRRKRTFREEHEASEANEEMPSAQTSTRADIAASSSTVSPSHARHEAESSPSSQHVKSEESFFPYTQLSQTIGASAEEEVLGSQPQEIQASQPQEGPTEVPRHNRETNTSGRRRYRRAHIHIYLFHRREDQTPTRAASLLDHVLTGLKILFIITILYYVFARDSASFVGHSQKRKFYIVHSA
ncbi:hypothetical protein BD408DRAFT_435441 [Parasitella parasitica]|nr:hypothetical protein BD408DRAFT_435441 [Parasitella parasitica]